MNEIGIQSHTDSKLIPGYIQNGHWGFGRLQKQKQLVCIACTYWRAKRIYVHSMRSFFRVTSWILLLYFQYYHIEFVLFLFRPSSCTHIQFLLIWGVVGKFELKWKTGKPQLAFRNLRKVTSPFCEGFPNAWKFAEKTGLQILSH